MSSSVTPEVFTELYQALVTDLLERDWNPDEDGLSPEEFVDLLAQAPISQQLAAVDQPVLAPSDLPLALTEFYLTVGRVDDLMETTHFFFDPDELLVVDDYLVFLEDDEESEAWGVPVDQLPLPDPLIWRRSVGADAPEGSGEWEREAGTVSELITDVITWSLSDPDEDDDEEEDDDE